MNLSPQCRLVLNHIHRHGYISQLVATNYGIPRLASRIHDLKIAGIDVRAESVRDMKGKRYTRYSLAQQSLALAA